MPKPPSFIIDALRDGRAMTAGEIRKMLVSKFDLIPTQQLDFSIIIGLSCCKERSLIVEHPARFQLASAAKPQQPVISAADLLAIERSLNEELRKEIAICERENNQATLLAMKFRRDLDGLQRQLTATSQALAVALETLSREELGNLFTELQESKP